MSKVFKNSPQQSKLILEELEERRLFSGGIEGLIASDLDPQAQAIYADADKSKTANANDETSAAAAERQSQEIVFVDAGVDNYQQLVDDLNDNADSNRNIEVVVLDQDKDGIEEISEFLSHRDGLDAIHIISHGDDGSIQLGNTSLDGETLEDNNLKVALWANSFTESGDILIYGCNLAETEVGQALINDISSLTLADVAASTDLTGAASQGGDWALEFSVGQVESKVAVSAELQQEYQGTFATYTVTSLNDSGAGSLREAIGLANTSGGADTIEFGVAGTISLSSALPTIDEQLTIDGSTAPGYSGDPVVEIDGTGVSGNGLRFTSGADDSTVNALMITNFTGNGIQIDNGADGITITGNWIGTTGTGTTGDGNSNNGINVQGASAVIGGTGANDGNVITNNGNEGINLTGAGATGTLIQGNIIGLDPDGITGSGNGDVGIALLSGSHNTTIGGTDPNAGNIISMNYEGIEINSNNNTIQGNYIGTDITGTLDRGNRSDDGIEIQNNATGNLIGGTEEGAGNLIAFNQLDGINLVSGSGNAVLGNEIHSNGDMDVDLGAGANNNQIAPALTLAYTNGSQISITGSLSSAANSFYRVEFFGANQTYLGFTNVATDGSGNVGIDVLLTANVANGESISATATLSDAAYTSFTDTSELSSNIFAAAAAEFTVTNTADSGAGSLRQAIINANAATNAGFPDSITFDIAGAGPHTIALSSALPDITEAVNIDGSSEPDFGGAPVVVLDGSGTSGANGLSFIAGSDGSEVRGLAIVNFDGVGILLTDSDGHTIAGNYIGTDGSSDLGNGSWGLEMTNSANNTIGGNTSTDRNVISGNGVGGVTLYGASTTGNTVIGNYIGTNAAGTGTISNTTDGISISGGANANTIGGDQTAGEGNVISGNGNDGIEIGNSGADNNKIYGNFIGTDYTGNVDLGNTRHGIVLYNQVQGNEIGGTGTGEGNVISGNNGWGVIIDGNGDSSTSGNTIVANTIGLDVDGDTGVANTSGGIQIFGSASGNTIGVTDAGNVISGNSGAGIYITGSGTDSNTIQGNLIGTNAAGTVGIQNDSNNIDINQGATNTVVGGTANGAGNVIGATGSDGITIWGGATTGTVVQGNYVGTDKTQSYAFGANDDGIQISGGSSDNLVGGTDPGAGNIVANNGGDGLRISDNSTTDNALLGNLSYNNLSSINIDSAANGSLNVPALSSAAAGVTQVTVSGSYNGAANDYYRIEFFADDGGVQTYLGFTNIATDGSGNATFSETLSASVAAGATITATATDTDSGYANFVNTSNASAGVVAVAADITSDLQVHHTYDAGQSAQDSSGNNRDGTLSADATVDTSAGTNQIGDGKLTLDGTDDYVDLNAHAAGMAGYTEGTIGAWINTSAGTQQTVFNLGDTAGSSFATLYLQGDGKLRWTVSEGGSTTVDVTSVASLNDDSWHHVAVTVSPSGTSLWVDGVELTGGAATYSNGNASSTNFFDDLSGVARAEVGAYELSGTMYDEFNGLIDDFRIYNRALTAGDIGELQSSWIFGTPGDDVIAATAGNDQIDALGGNDTIDYSGATGPVILDLTASAPQNTGGSGIDNLLGFERVIGSTGNDSFQFGNPVDGATYQVDGNTGSNTIDLSGYASSAISFGDGTMTIDMGGGQSFTIEYTNISQISFSDITADVLTNDIALGSWSGTALFIDGDEAFKLDMGGGTISWTYIRASNTLSITSASGVGTSSTLAITDLNGSDLQVDQITLDADFGNLTTNVGVGTISLAGAGSDINGAFTIGGDLGSITMDQLNGTLDVLGNADTITLAGDLLSGKQLTVTGDVGTLSIGDDLLGRVYINGSVDTVDVTGNGGRGIIGASGILSIGGDAGYIHVFKDIVSGADVSITGNVTTFEVDSDIIGSVDIGGNVGTFHLTGLNPGNGPAGSHIAAAASVTLGGDVTTLTIDGNIKADVVAQLNIDGSVGTMTITGDVLSDVNIGGDLDSASMSSVDPAAVFTASSVVGTLVFDVGGTDYGGTYANPVVYVFNGSTQTASATSSNTAPTDLLITDTSAGGLSLNQDGGNDAYLLAGDGAAIFSGLTATTMEIQFASTTLPVDGGDADFVTYAAATQSSNNIWFGTWRNDAGAGHQLGLGVDGAYVYATGFDANTLFDGQQHTVSVVWDAGNYEFFVDGISVGSGTGFKSGHTVPGGGELVVGMEQDSIGGGFQSDQVLQATVYDVRIFDDARTAPEILAGHGQTLAPTEPGMLANWVFDNLSTGGAVIDTVSGNDLSVMHASGAGFVGSVPSLTMTLSEDAPDLTVVGSAATIDPDSGDTFTYTLLDNSGGRFDINSTTGEIFVLDGSLIDFESASSHNITVQTTDSGGLTYDEVFTIAVTNVNYAPVLAGANNLTSINEDDVTNPGTLVSDLISGQVSDPDSGASEGIAVVGVDDINGTWQYTTDGGSNWTAFGAVDASTARLLAADANTYVRFVPNANWNGTVTNGITFHAWDQTSGTAGGTADLAGTVTVRDEFTSGNGFTGDDGTVSWTGDWQQLGETDGANAGTVTADGTPEALAIGGDVSVDITGDGVQRQVDLSSATSATLTLDAWRSTDTDNSEVSLQVSADGSNWIELEEFDMTNAPDSPTGYSYDISAYASATTWIRFEGLGTTDAGETNYLYFDNVQIAYQTAANTGGNTAFSSNSASSSITVNSVPINNLPAAQSTTEDTAITFNSTNGNPISITGNAGDNLAVTLSVDNGTLALSQTTGLSFDAGANGSASMTVTGTVEDINAALDGLQYLPTSNYTGADTLTLVSTETQTYALDTDANLSGYYSFEGGNANDQSPGGANDATLIGDATITTDVDRGEVLSLDGSADSAQISGLFGNPADVTLSAWVNLTTADTLGADVLSLGDNLTLRLDDTFDGPPTLRGSYYDGSQWNNLEFETTLAGAGWNHVSFVFDDTNNSATLYLNGVAVNTATVTSSISYSQGSNTFIGAHGNGSTSYDFNGLIDDARVYTRALSTTEVAALAAEQSSDSDSLSIDVTAAVNTAPTGLQTTATSTGGLSLNQDGGNDAYLIADDGEAILGGLTAMTTEVQFSMDSFGDTQYFTSYDTTSQGDAVRIGIHSGGEIRLLINGTRVDSTAMDYRTLADGEQHTLSVTWNSSGGLWEIFVDGVSLDSGSGLEDGASISTGSGTLVYGNEQDGVDTGYDTVSVLSATLYDIRIFDDVRSAGEIAANHDQTVANTESGLLANWTFDDLSTGGVVTDTVSANNLTVRHASGTGFVTSTSQLGLSVSENASNSDVIGSVAAIDPDVGDTFTYALTNDAGGRFAIDNSGQLTVADSSLIDFEAAASHDITVRVTDSGGLTYAETFTISVTDVNDAPLVGGQDSGSVTEDSGVSGGNVGDSGSLTISDADPGESTFVAATINGAYGDLVIDAAGNWSYSADNSQAAIQSLDAGESLQDTLTVTTADGSTHDVVITINGSEDAAVIGGTTTGSVTEDGTLTASSTLTITDADASDNPLSFNDVAATLGDNGYGDFEITSNSWTYTLNNGHASVQALDAGETLTDTYTFGASDGSTQTVTVTINGSEDAPVISGVATGTAAEDGTLTASDTLTITDADSNDNPVGFNDVAATSGDNGYGNFEITGNTWTYTLNNGHASVQALDTGETLTDTFTFTATDGSSQQVTVTINGAEDVPVFDSTAITTATEDVAYSYTITTSDVDVESVTITAPTLPAWLTFVDNGDGTATLNGTPTNAEVGSHNVVLNVSDGTLSSNQNFIIVVGNTNDPAVIAGVDTGSVQEDVGVVSNNISTTGTLTISDPDTGESTFQAATVNGTYGDLTIDTAGNWTYTADNTQAAIQQLDVTEFLTDTLTVISFDGTTHDVVITINGLEDAAVISGTTTGSVTEDGTLTSSGALTITDTDSSDTPGFADVPSTAGDNGYGNFVMTAGTWTYTLDNNHAAVQALDVGETLTDTHTFTASDGSPQMVTITINGAEDVPMFDSTAVTAATEDVAYGYTITTSDVDVEAVTITAPTLPVWLTFVDNGDGTATLSGTPTNAEVGSHNVVLNVSDGTLSSNQNFTIVVGNTNDPAVIGGVDTGSVQEDVAVVTNNISTTGTLTIADPDTGESTFQAETVNGTYGDLTIDSAGNWSYTADNTQAAIQQLDALESITDTLTVTSFDGTTHNLVITINGSEDASVISGTTIGSVTEDGTLTSSGTLTISDTDSSDPTDFADLTPQAGDNGHGTFEITANTWTYTLDNNDPAVQALDAGETLTDTYTFTAPDGATQQVTVTINGAEDAPVFDSTAVTAATEDLAYSYTITTSDADIEAVTITAPTLPAWLTFVDNGDGTAILSGTPTNAEVGNHNVVLTVSDGTLSSNQNFSISVSNTNDPAVIAGVDTGSVQEDVGVVANNISTTGTLTIADPDAGESTFQAATINGTYGDLTIDTAGNWTYTADNTQAAIQQLDVLESITDMLTVTSFDGTTHNLVITINGSEDVAVISGTTTGSVTEDGTLTSSGALTISDTDTNDTPSFTDLGATAGDNGYGSFEMTSGTWTYTLDNDHAAVQALDAGETLSDTHTFTATDGSTQQVTITINGAEDAPVFDSAAVTSATEDVAYSYTITTSDVDVEAVTITAPTLPAWLTFVDNGDGTATLSGTPTNAEVGSHNVVLNVSDGTLSSNQNFTIVVGNTNDPAVIGGTDTGAVQEDVAVVTNNISTSGTLTITDPDTGESSFQAATINGTCGDLTIDSAGNWTYTADNTQAAIQQLDALESITDTLTVTSFDGTTHNVVITINGSEDAAVIGGTTTGSVAEDGTQTSSGTLTISDTDTSDTPGFADVPSTAGDNGYGSFEMTSGTWTYTLDNNNPAVQALDAGETLSDTHTFTATDGSTQQVSIIINGAEDAAVITGTTTGSVTEDVTLISSGTLSISDTDTSDTPGFADVPSTAGDNGFGNFEMTSGTWTYTLDNNNTAVQALDVGETLTDTHTFTASDGSTQVVTITINGAEDAPVFDSTAIIAATEDVAYSYTITTSDVDIESVIITAPTLPAWLTFVDNGDGTATLSGTPTNAEVGSHNVTLTVSDGTLSGNQNFTIVVTNTNDPAVIGGADTGTVQEDVAVVANNISTSGTLTISDPDAGEQIFQIATINGTYGDLVMQINGEWTYTADNTQAAIQQLDAGESMTDTLTVASFDGTTHNVVITINGSEDAAVIGGTTTGSVTEDGTLTSSGALTITDTDNSDSPSFADVGATAGDNGYGNFVMTSGTWTYTLDNNNPVVQALDAGETLSETHTFTATDGSTQQVTITINGAEDTPVFDSAAVTSATEDVAYSYTITTSDVDIESVTITAPTLPAWLTFFDNGDGTATLSGTPTNAEVGSHNVVLNVSDGTLSGNQNFTIVVGNTNDPAVIGGADSGAVQEDVAVVANNISTSGSLTIADPDAGESSFVAATINGAYGDLFIDSAGNWSYSADNSQISIQALDALESITDTLTVTSFDGTTHNVVITINGSEDAAVTGGTASGSVTEDGSLTATDALTITDIDASDNPVNYLDVTPTPGANGYGNFEISGNIWTYTLTNGHAAVQALDVGETLTDSYTFLASDGSSQLVTVTINGSEDAPTLDNAIVDQTATEDLAFNFTFTANTFGDLDTSDTLIYSATLADSSPLPGWLNFDAATRTFSGTPANSDVGPIDIRITASDGSSTIADTFTLTVLNVDDAPLIGGDDTGTITEDVGVIGGVISTTGSLTITDPDAGESSFQPETVNGSYGDLTIDISGNWIYDANNNQAAIQALDAGQSIIDTLTVSAFDGTTHDIVITINGAEDSAVIGGTVVGAVTEDSALVVSDTLMITDVDSNDNPIGFNDVAPATGSNGYGSFEMTGNTWTYTLNNSHAFVQALDVGETLIDTYTFSASDGNTQVVTVTINGSEDAPVIGGTATGAVSEDGVLAASDTLTITDTDSSDNPISFNDVTPTPGINGYGSFEMSGNTWTYTLNNSHASVQALDAGETLTDLFTFSASDGSTRIVTVTIAGAEDAPTLDNAIADQTATEDVTFNFTFASNTFGDLDTSDTLVYSATLADSSPLPGWLNFDAATRTFSGTPANADVGQIDIRITAGDGSGTVTDTFTLTVLNANNAPLIGGVDSGQVNEDQSVSGGKIATSGVLTIADPDVGESSFVGSTINGALGTLTIDTAGNWRYSADNDNPEIQALQSGESITETMTVTTADGSTHNVVITINGATEASRSAPPSVQPPPVEPPPEEEPPPADEKAEDDVAGEDPIVDEIVRSPQDVTPPPVRTEVDSSSYLQQEEARADRARVNQEKVKYAAKIIDQPQPLAIQQQAIQQQNLDLGELSLQVSDDEALNEKFELELLARIDSMHSSMDHDAAQTSADDVEVQIVMGSTASLTAGIVSWVLRGGSLLASFMSTVPLLNRFDPLPILKSREDEEDNDEESDDDGADTRFRQHQKRVDKMFSDKGSAAKQDGYMNE